MKIKRMIDSWVWTVALALMVLPMAGLYSFLSSPQEVRADSVEHATRVSQLAKQLAREIGKLDKKGGFELAAHVLSVHSKIPAHELLGRGVKLKQLSTAAMVARITGQSLDDVTASGVSSDEVIKTSGVDKQSASKLLTAAIVGI